jgi:Na+-translocating ferredoxin:NAD+ oxidoreductase RnfD subunit
MVVVLSFCGYLAWLGGPGPYIGGLIAILDLGAMFGMFFGLRPEQLPGTGSSERRRLVPHAPAATLVATSPR